jgi:cyclase
MERREFLFKSIALGSVLSLPYQGISLTPRNNSFTELRRNVGYYTNRGGAIGWLATPNTLVVVDSQYPPEARSFIAGIKDRTDHPVDLLINTHHHGDHTAGNGVFREHTRTIVSHSNVPGLQRRVAQQRGTEADQTFPTMTFETAWKFDTGDEVVHARYFGSAHTGGDCIVYFEKANVVHTGDLVFNRIYPFIDRPGGASVHGWIAVLYRTLETFPDDAYYIFGHGREGFGVTGDRDDVKYMREYLEAVIEHVQTGLNRGRTRDQIVNIHTLPGFPDHISPADFLSLRANLEVTYAELTEDR